MDSYIHSLGMLMSDVNVDFEGRLFILVEGKDTEGEVVYEEVGIPEKYQTFGNVEIIRELRKKNEKHS